MKTDSRKYTSSSSFKMALFFGIQLGLGVIILAYFGYYFARGHLIHGAESVIDTEIRYLSRMDGPSFRQALESPPDGRVFMLSGPNGNVQGGNLAALPANVSVLAEGSLLFTTPDKRRFAARFHVREDGSRLLVGVDITEVLENYNFMLGLSLLSIVLMLVVILTSFFISGFVVSRTNRIAATAKNIMDTGNLSQRIDVDSKWDDLSYLSGVLNAFLQRVGELVEGVRRVSDNIAHDLRTPLTRLRNNLEELKSRARDDAETAAADELIAEADHLLGTFNALLRIARIETARQRHHFVPVALAPLLRDVADLYEPIAEQKSIRLKMNMQDVVVTGDRDLLFQAFANLLDNAIKFSPPASQITLSLADDNGRAVCTIADQGAGIQPHEHEKVFTRFYRGDSSRNAPGSGLGLSLVAAVIGLHEGRIVLEEENPGLRVKITI